MKLLTAAINRLPEFQQLLVCLEGGRCPVALSGVSAIHRVHMAAGVGLLAQRPVVLLCADEGEGERLAQDLAAFAETPVPVLTPRSFTFHNAASVSRQWEHKRLSLMRQLQQGQLPYVVATVEGQPMRCTISGVLRGILPEGTPVFRGMKAGDVDPRGKREYCDTVSDKALAVGGGVLEAVLALSGKLKEEP